MKRGRFKRLAGLSLCVIALSFMTFAGDIPCIWTDVERIVAIGDLHGDYESFVEIITAPGVGLVDKNLRWIGGRTHLVQTGDVLDRGSRPREILDLLMRLEKEAEAAGGRVHFLLGNHEEMNLTGIAFDYPDYINAGQFVSFLPEEFKKAKNTEFLASLPPAEREWFETHGIDYAPGSKPALFWERLKNRRDAAGDEAREAYMKFFNDTYGPWLMQKNVVIRINAIVFAHGGISEKYSNWKLADINRSYRKELESMKKRSGSPSRLPRSFRPEMVYQPDSPLWYRDLAEKDEKAAERQVYRILDNLGARFIVVGHTIARNGGRSPTVTPAGMSRFDGRVWTIDTGISSYYGGVLSALIYERGVITLWPPDSAELPEKSDIKADQAAAARPEDIEVYLRTAAVVQRKSGASGRTDPWTITLDDGKTVRRALFKYIDRRRPDPLMLPDSYQYELAAYALDKYLRLGLVPPVIEREIEGFPGSLQVFVDNSVRESGRKAEKIEPPDPDAFAAGMQAVRVFDNLVFNACAEAEDTYIHRETWKVARVDFSESFAPERRLVPGCDFSRCPRNLYEGLRRWDDRRVADIMAPYLNAEEIKALNHRRALILQKIDRLIQDKGEKAVIFDRIE